MIDKRLIKKHAPDVVGAQVHVNHDGCSSGEDHKKRLYIKRTPKGLLAYCHHCGESGFVGEIDNTARLASWIKKTKIDPPPVAKLPDLCEISMYGKAWLTKYHIADHSFFYGVVGRPHEVAIYLENHNQLFSGFQIRNLSGIGPKYRTVYSALADRDNSAWLTRAKNKTLVITEDYLSAYRIHIDGNKDSLALLGTHLSDVTMFHIEEKNYDKIVIWLDPDLAGVSASEKIEDKLRHYLPLSVLKYFVHKEAKEFLPEELGSMIKDW
jgi:hypothetical protein